MTERVYLFSNGAQFMDWSAANCERCKKSVEEWDNTGTAWPTCELEAAIVEATMGDGSFAPDIAQRIRAPEYAERYNWPCNEVEWADWWKVEWVSRREQEANREQHN